MPTVKLNGVALYYEVSGAGDRVVLTHGSWTDGDSWAPVVGPLAQRYEVVTWDRRGHSRSRAGERSGSLAEDAADLAALIEHLGEPVHVVGNSYGASITLTLVAGRPDLVRTAAVHEPPLFGLLEGTEALDVIDGLAVLGKHLDVVATLIETGDHRDAAEHFIENVAFGPGGWEQLPGTVRDVLEANAATFLDEQRDPIAGSIDAAALAAATVPVLLTRGTVSPPLFSAVIAELSLLIRTAHVSTLAGAGHVPHTTHPECFVAGLVAFHNQVRAADGQPTR